MSERLKKRSVIRVLDEDLRTKLEERACGGDLSRGSFKKPAEASLSAFMRPDSGNNGDVKHVFPKLGFRTVKEAVDEDTKALCEDFVISERMIATEEDFAEREAFEKRRARRQLGLGRYTFTMFEYARKKGLKTPKPVSFHR